VFAYGSLMWNPGFATPETMPARLHGWHRALCIYSEHYRGTPERPGLILGLLPGGECRGLAHRLPSDDYEAVRHYLLEREIHNDGVYRETVHPIHLGDGRVVPALVYLADREHRQFAGKLPHAKALAIVRQASGLTGTNLAYVQNTAVHLRELGLRDRALEAVAREASTNAEPRRPRRLRGSGSATPRGPARP
jgi:cation transport protein ChaC